MLIHLAIYLLAFLGIWVGSGIAIHSVERISRSLRVSSFLVSFIVLGIFTSISEFSVGINSILENDPEIYVGNLIGASIVIFMLIIPLLAVFGKPIHINREFHGFNLIASLVVIALPVILALDGNVGKRDGIFAMGFYGLLVISLQSRKSLLDKLKTMNNHSTVILGKELLKIIFGVATIFISSRFVVDQTLYFSHRMGISPFLISLLLIGIGTNIPELSLVIRSRFMKNNQVAFGDYVGSAAFNTFLLGFLTFLNGNPVQLTNSYLISLVFLLLGLGLFHYFARSKNTLTKKEGLVLLSVYLVFLVSELLIHNVSF